MKKKILIFGFIGIVATIVIVFFLYSPQETRVKGSLEQHSNEGDFGIPPGKN